LEYLKYGTYFWCEFKVAVDNTCSIEVLLNGKTATIPLQFSTNSEQACLLTDDLENWDFSRVASINKTCEALHTGKDGISKTSSEVAVHADVLLNKIKMAVRVSRLCSPTHFTENRKYHRKKALKLRRMLN
jgi:hypothetical protein